MSHPTTVLLIEDERLLLKATGLVLGHAGFAVAGAASGPAGLAEARNRRPDLILLDIMMPGMDGWEVLRELKSDPATSPIPVIIFTAKEHVDGLRFSLAAGAADYITKPFENDDLIHRIRKILADRPAAPAVTPEETRHDR